MIHNLSHVVFSFPLRDKICLTTLTVECLTTGCLFQSTAELLACFSLPQNYQSVLVYRRTVSLFQSTVELLACFSLLQNCQPFQSTVYRRTVSLFQSTVELLGLVVRQPRSRLNRSKVVKKCITVAFLVFFSCG